MLKSKKSFYLSIFFCLALPQASAATEILTTLDEHRGALTQVLETAQKRVIIVSPFLTSFAIDSDALISKIKEAQGRGVAVVVYTDSELDLSFIENDKGEKKVVLKDTSKSARLGLLKNFVPVYELDKVHSKILISDDNDITIGSFNWLSAVRNPIHQYARHEQSIRVKGPTAEGLIASSISALNKLKKSSYGNKELREFLIDLAKNGSMYVEGDDDETATLEDIARDISSFLQFNLVEGKINDDEFKRFTTIMSNILSKRDAK